MFLFIAGVTGAVISWDHELDEWLNPDLFQAKSGRGGAVEPLPATTLAERVESADARVHVRSLPLPVESGETVLMFVEPRLDPTTGKPFELGFNQMAIDPVTGDVQGRCRWGDVSLSRENLLPFLYKLHYSLHLPEGLGIEPGVLFMGGVGIVWALDCFIALRAGPRRGQRGRPLTLQAQFPLHSGRLLGIPGRVLVSTMGPVVAMLSVTDVVIWGRKRRAKEARARKEKVPVTATVA